MQINLFQSEAGHIWSQFYKNASETASDFPIDMISNYTIRLQIQSLQDKGTSVLSSEKYNKVSCQIPIGHPGVEIIHFNWQLFSVLQSFL